MEIDWCSTAERWLVYFMWICFEMTDCVSEIKQNDSDKLFYVAHLRKAGRGE